ncbi:MAG: 2-succinyl-5-enolpyruvyl-6-hydroxy-3-cyclohexene-1-carboxylic-acid synthase, partial [Syntrophaceae bacterium]|nr:2-succinyl-5-enolpyruvyl-6-hydroxy-3-cyclohexene-1-carboxylic-acid synthase [Syntrophaceae bacterium]
MISTKKNAQYLASALLSKGISDIVISPGSRNAPLINTFTAIEGFRCLNIVDERCAAFFALGMALRLNRPVAIACTSGSAVLNYAPAIVEAYYQKVPLLVLTADRPPEWIDQGDGQTIRQNNIYANFIKAYFNLADRIETEEEAWFSGRVLNQALNTLRYPEAGPVQINVPFPEPLYGLTDESLPAITPIVLHRTEPLLTEDTVEHLVQVWNRHPRKMILAGQMAPDSDLNAILDDLAADSSVAVLTETLSNLSGNRFNGCIDNALSAIREEEAYGPDLLITFGGQIVSKKIKAFLRKYRPATHWHFSPSGEHMDTFMSLTDVIPTTPHSLLRKMRDAMPLQASDYGDQWRDLDRL